MAYRLINKLDSKADKRLRKYVETEVWYDTHQLLYATFESFLIGVREATIAELRDRYRGG
jgi:hypothetical protein